MGHYLSREGFLSATYELPPFSNNTNFKTLNNFILLNWGYLRVLELHWMLYIWCWEWIAKVQHWWFPDNQCQGNVRLCLHLLSFLGITPPEALPDGKVDGGLGTIPRETLPFKSNTAHGPKCEIIHSSVMLGHLTGSQRWSPSSSKL